MAYAVYVPSGHACRLYRFSHALGFTGLFTDDFDDDDCNIVICATPERISMFRADSWVAAVQQETGHHFILEELDWVGHHPSRRTVVYRRHMPRQQNSTNNTSSAVLEEPVNQLTFPSKPSELEPVVPSVSNPMPPFKEVQGTTLRERLEDPLTTSILGELLPQFEIVNVPPSASGVYVGLTDGAFQIHVLQGEVLGGVDAVVAHPQHTFISTAHTINKSILQIHPMREHVLFTGLWWQPVNSASLKPAFASCDTPEVELFQQRLKHGMGPARIQSELIPVIALCAKKRRATRTIGLQIPTEQDQLEEYALLARRSWKAVSYYIHAAQHDAVFAVSMHEACARWADMCVDEPDKELLQEIRHSLTSQPTTTIRPNCRKVITKANKMVTTTTTTTSDSDSTTATTTSGADMGVALSAAQQSGQGKSGASDEQSSHQAMVASVFSVFQSDDEDERSAFVRHITNEYAELEAVAQQFERFAFSTYLGKKQREALVLYQTAAAAFEAKVYTQAKELFWECLKSSTCFLMASDVELSTAYYNAARALQLCSESHYHSSAASAPQETPKQLAGSAKELYSICVQLRSEQYRNKIVDLQALNKAKKALEECQ